MDIYPHEYTAGDAEPRLSGIVTDEDGAFDLTGYTVRMTIDRDGYGQNTLTKDATVATPANGSYDFGAWASTDLVASDKPQLVKIKLVSGSSVTTIDQFLIKVGRA